MIQGFFGDKGELFFEIELITVDGSIITVDVLLDTGFTDWLAMDIQDVESLGWRYIKKREMKTARGEFQFDVYEGTVIFDSQEMNIPVVVGDGIPEILIGLSWLEDRRLVVDKKAGILTLE
ncbi:MAG: aspartyl protease [Okeania sp. SIO3C4]|nr:aspartyl protease [Okeania sp. SIO3B3]NER05907.1 aspartyl protease [Okeania sp. SIO3C4]